MATGDRVTTLAGMTAVVPAPEPTPEPGPEPVGSLPGELQVIGELEAELAGLSAELTAIDADENEADD